MNEVAAPRAVVGVPIIDPDQIRCRVCAEVRTPIQGLLKNGQIGPCCRYCGAEQGIAVAGGEPRGFDDSNKQIKTQLEITTAAIEPSTIIPKSTPPAATPAPTPARPAPMRAATREQLPLGGDEWAASDDGTAATPESVIMARLATARLELAKLQIDQCRMRGLEAEVKALEKTLSRVTGGGRREGVN